MSKLEELRQQVQQLKDQNALLKATKGNHLAAPTKNKILSEILIF